MIFSKIGDYLESNHKMVILDLDRGSCYTTALIALYPMKLGLVKRAVESGSIWEALSKEFIVIDREEYYKKPYVKACFYSVIFGGGEGGMRDAILKNIRESIVMSEKEFEKSPSFEDEKSKANGIVAAFTSELVDLDIPFNRGELVDCNVIIVNEFAMTDTKYEKQIKAFSGRDLISSTKKNVQGVFTGTFDGIFIITSNLGSDITFKDSVALNDRFIPVEFVPR